MYLPGQNMRKAGSVLSLLYYNGVGRKRVVWQIQKCPRSTGHSCFACVGPRSGSAANCPSVTTELVVPPFQSYRVIVASWETRSLVITHSHVLFQLSLVTRRRTKHRHPAHHSSIVLSASHLDSYLVTKQYTPRSCRTITVLHRQCPPLAAAVEARITSLPVVASAATPGEEEGRGRRRTLSSRGRRSLEISPWYVFFSSSLSILLLLWLSEA